MLDSIGFDKMLRDLFDTLVHGKVVVPGGDNHVYPGNETILINLVVMDESSSRRLGNTDAFKPVRLRYGTNVLVQDVRFIEELFEALYPVKDLNQSRIVLME